MDIGNLLTPWLFLALVLVPLWFAEKWIQSHLYGVGWLLTNNEQTATTLYYVFLLPGVFIHEVTQWLVAGMLNVRIKKIQAWPEPQKDGTLRLDFVQVDETDWFRAAIIGAIPLIIGIATIWTVSLQILNLENFLDALSTTDLTVIGPAARDLVRKPDFFLWLYLMFAITNAMWPTPADRKGWPLLLAIIAGALGFLVLIGVGDVLHETFTGPVAHAVDLLTTAFATVLIVEVLAILFIGFFEEILERITKRKFQYSTPTPPKKDREPGSNLPLPAGALLPSIYNMELPVPKPSDHDDLKKQAEKAAPEEVPSPAPAARKEAPTPPARERPGDASPPGIQRPRPREQPQPSSPQPDRQPAREAGTGPTGFERPKPGETEERPSRRPERLDEDERLARPGPSRRTPDESPRGPSRRPERPDEDERPARPGPSRRTPDESPRGPSRRPDMPSRRPERPDEDVRPARPGPSRRTPDESPRGPSRRPGTPSRRSERPDAEDTSPDEDDALSFRRRRSARGDRPPVTPRAAPPEDDSDDDDGGDDIEYIDIDDFY